MRKEPKKQIFTRTFSEKINMNKNKTIHLKVALKLMTMILNSTLLHKKVKNNKTKNPVS